MALVEVPRGRLEAERPDRPDAADAEDQLLVQAHLAAADVEDVRDRAVGLVVLGQVGVEEQDRHASDLGEPHRDGQLAARQRDRDRQREPVLVLDPAERQPREVVVGVVVLLVAVGVDRLAEVALAVQQSHADRGEGHVARGLHVVARRARPGRPSRCRATRGGRTPRRSRRSGRRGRRRSAAGTSGPRRSPCTASNSASMSWYSARNLASSRRRDQSVEPLMTGMGFR